MTFPFDYWVGDSETYPNCYISCFIHSSGLRTYYEISDWRNDSTGLIDFVRMCKERGVKIITFNGLGFDYPIWHMLIKMGKADAATLYEKAMTIINSEDKFANMIYPSDRFVDILDIYRVKHYNNKARSTSLKALEFNMRMDNISDLPFLVGSTLTLDQIPTLRDYCFDDTAATKEFTNRIEADISFRQQLIPTLGEDVLNANDVKIGTLIFQKELEKAGVQCYEYGSNGRQPKQTPRDRLVLRDAILPWIELETPGFKRILEHLRSQVITETKGVFDGLVAHEYGLDFVFGTGGLHAAVENKAFVATDDLLIESRDVSSYYPNLAITNRFYPEHLGEKFCEVYKGLYEKRSKYAKGSPENAAYKLALNGTFGKAGDKFSVFYDLLFLLKITLNGQLLLCLLIENLVKVPTVRMVMCNTDGIEYTIHPDYVSQADAVCEWWMKKTGLVLEGSRYEKLFVRDCNNYCGKFVDGKVKRKGAYEYDVQWHQDASALIVPKVAEQVLIYDKPLRQTIMEWPDRMDFMQRIKVQRNGFLRWGDNTVQNTTRYYVSVGGKPLVKWLPPTVKKPDQWRSFSVESGWTVQVCNDIKDAVLPINYEYYVQEVEKLCLSVM